MEHGWGEEMVAMMVNIYDSNNHSIVVTVDKKKFDDKKKEIRNNHFKYMYTFDVDNKRNEAYKKQQESTNDRQK